MPAKQNARALRPGNRQAAVDLLGIERLLKISDQFTDFEFDVQIIVCPVHERFFAVPQFV
ncbi:hypothetical protein D3C85_1918690 [compost metagenome]